MDPLLIANIAASVISFVSAFLTKTGEAAAIKTGEDLYMQLSRRFRAKPSAIAALTDLEGRPSDGDLQAAVRVQLRKLMEEDPAFAAEMNRVAPTVRVVQASPRAGRDLVVGRDFTGRDHIEIDAGQSDPFMDAWDRGTNMSRPVLLFGLVIALGGFGFWMLTIFNLIGSGTSASFNSVSSMMATNGPIAFGCVIAGGVIMMIARMMGRSSRR